MSSSPTWKTGPLSIVTSRSTLLASGSTRASLETSFAAANALPASVSTACDLGVRSRPTGETGARGQRPFALHVRDRLVAFGIGRGGAGDARRWLRSRAPAARRDAHGNGEWRCRPIDVDVDVAEKKPSVAAASFA